MSDDFDFVVGGPPEPDAPDEDVIETGYRARPRLIRWLAVLAALAVVIGLVVHARSGSSPTARPPVARPPVADTSTPPRPGPIAPAVTDVGAPITPGVYNAVDIALGADVLYVVRYGSLAAVDIATQNIIARVRVPELANYDSGPEYRAVVDEAAGRVWLVRMGGVTPPKAIEFDATTLRRLATVQVPDAVQNAAVLGDRVYLAAGDGVRLLDARTGTARLVPGAAGYAGNIAADPLHDRLLVMDGGFPTRILALRPDGRHQVAAFLPFGAGQVAVTRGVIWAAGFAGDGAQVVRLNPTTLKPVGSARDLAMMLGPDPMFVATGSRSVWVRGGPSGDELWCMDATTGAASQRFDGLSGPVTSEAGFAPPTSRGGFAFVAPNGVVRPLVLTGCPG